MCWLAFWISKYGVFYLYDHKAFFCTSLLFPECMSCVPRKIVWELLEDTNKYVALKNKKKERERKRSGCMMPSNVTSHNFLFPVSVVFLYILNMEDDFLKMKLILTNNTIDTYFVNKHSRVLLSSVANTLCRTGSLSFYIIWRFH